VTTTGGRVTVDHRRRVVAEQGKRTDRRTDLPVRQQANKRASVSRSVQATEPEQNNNLFGVSVSLSRGGPMTVLGPHQSNGSNPGRQVAPPCDLNVQLSTNACSLHQQSHKYDRVELAEPRGTPWISVGYPVAPDGTDTMHAFNVVELIHKLSHELITLGRMHLICIL